MMCACWLQLELTWKLSLEVEGAQCTGLLDKVMPMWSRRWLVRVREGGAWTEAEVTVRSGQTGEVPIPLP